jgi:hypothetical protein
MAHHDSFVIPSRPFFSEYFAQMSENFPSLCAQAARATSHQLGRALALAEHNAFGGATFLYLPNLLERGTMS